MIHLPLQQPDPMHPPPPLLHAVVALRMCQPVHGLVGMVIHSAHQLLQCCAVDALTRRHGPDSGVSPLTLGRRGRHPHSSQGARGRADARTMLLRPASNRRIPLCSPALLHPAAHKTRDQRLLDAELEGRTETSVRLQRMKIPWVS